MADTRDIEDIASRIVDIVVSPDTVTGLINGALTVPLDLGYLTVGYFYTDSRFEHQTQRIRMAEAIHNDILNYENITNAIELIFKEFNKHLTVNQQDKAYRGVFNCGSVDYRKNSVNYRCCGTYTCLNDWGKKREKLDWKNNIDSSRWWHE